MDQYAKEAVDALNTVGLSDKDLEFFRQMAQDAIARTHQAGYYMIIDTHTHLYLEEFQPSPQEAVVRAIEAGVEKMIFPNVDLSTIGPMKELHAS